MNDWRKRIITPNGQQWHLWGPKSESIYIRSGLSIPALAKRLKDEYNPALQGDIPPPSKGHLYRWSKAREWNKQREAYSATPIKTDAALAEGLKFLAQEMEKAVQEGNTSQVQALADASSKIESARKRLNPEELIKTVTMENLRGLAEFALEHNPQFAQWIGENLYDIYINLLDRVKVKL